MARKKKDGLSEGKELVSGTKAAGAKQKVDGNFKFGLAHLPMSEFTAREKRIAIFLLYAKSRAEIAKILELSENTIKTHVQNIFGKTEVKSQKEFMAKYLFGTDDF